MGGPYIEALRISPKYTSKDWEKLDRTKSEDWPKAADMVSDRLHGRFLSYADQVLGSEFSGFVVLAIDSLVLETLQQFREGCTDDWKDSERRVKDCLKGKRFKPDFTPEARKRYFLDIRCGLLHQAEAKKMWLVRRGEPTMLQRWPDKKGYTIDVKLFHKAVSDTFIDYLEELVQPVNDELRVNLWTKMDHICKIRNGRGAADAIIAGDVPAGAT